MMKAATFLLAATLTLVAADPMPSLQTTEGRVYKNVTITKYGAEAVTLKHAGGVAVIRYEYLPEEVRAAAEQKRPGGPRFFAGETAKNKASVEGQVFITTQGAGSYKFSDVDVWVFEGDVDSLWGSSNAATLQLPKPIGHTRTDADGKFRISVPSGARYVIFCQAKRLRSNNTWEHFEWRAPSSAIGKRDRINLAGDFLAPYRPVKIEPID